MNTEQIKMLADALREVAPRVPLNIDLWDKQACAAFLKVSVSKFDRYAARPDFPKARRLPTEGRGTPRWKAMEVVGWADKWTEK